jgi:hypothetical protein
MFRPGKKDEKNYINIMAVSMGLSLLGIWEYQFILENRRMMDGILLKINLGKCLYDDRLILIDFVLTSLPMFMLRFFEIHKGVEKAYIFLISFHLAK